jgi:hypothetical protein
VFTTRRSATVAVRAGAQDSRTDGGGDSQPEVTPRHPPPAPWQVRARGSAGLSGLSGARGSVCGAGGQESSRRRHRTGRKRIGSPNLQTLQDPFLLTLSLPSNPNTNQPLTAGAGAAKVQGQVNPELTLSPHPRRCRCVCCSTPS